VIKTYQVALAATSKRLSDPFGGDEKLNIPFRQLIISSSGADAYLGDASTVTTATGLKVATALPTPLSIGPFSTGPVKLSDFYAIGAGATLTILGVPF
jgi:hypothetical protein